MLEFHHDLQLGCRSFHFNPDFSATISDIQTKRIDVIFDRLINQSISAKWNGMELKTEPVIRFGQNDSDSRMALIFQ
jgi:hypothetical protein